MAIMLMPYHRHFPNSLRWAAPPGMFPCQSHTAWGRYHQECSKSDLVWAPEGWGWEEGEFANPLGSTHSMYAHTTPPLRAQVGLVTSSHS